MRSGMTAPATPPHPTHGDPGLHAKKHQLTRLHYVSDMLQSGFKLDPIDMTLTYQLAMTTGLVRVLFFHLAALCDAMHGLGAEYRVAAENILTTSQITMSHQDKLHHTDADMLSIQLVQDDFIYSKMHSSCAVNRPCDTRRRQSH